MLSSGDYIKSSESEDYAGRETVRKAAQGEGGFFEAPAEGPRQPRGGSQEDSVKTRHLTRNRGKVLAESKKVQ